MMAKKYQRIIQDLLTEFHGYTISGDRHEVEEQVVFDMEHDRYLLSGGM